MAKKSGFSWKRATGITKVKQSISKSTGVPLTKSGRQRKLGKAMSGGGCMVFLLLLVFGIIVFAVVM